MKKTVIAAIAIASIGLGFVTAPAVDRKAACDAQAQIRSTTPLLSGFKVPGCDK